MALRTTSEIIFGGSGVDNIQGRGGYNQIVGGYGADTLTGGPDVDYFVYYSAFDTADIITNFESGEDVIALRTPGWESLVFEGLLESPGAVNSGGYGYYPREAGGVTVYVDTDGVAGADLEIHVANVAALNASDFFVI